VADLFDKFDHVIAEVVKLNVTGHNPVGVVMEKILSPTEAIINGKHTILLGTYNYMGMTFDTDVIEAGRQALLDFGTGTTGSRVLNGTYEGHKKLEATLCDFYGTEHAIVFSTGYQANLGMCATLTSKGDYIIIDADSHASIYDGCAMGIADVVRFKHNDPVDLEKRLKRLPPEAGKLVVLEGVYSMLGDIAPLKELVRVAKAGGAMVMVDEAHAMGFFGERGRGVTEAAGCEADVDFIVGTFSKSVGTIGGYVVGNHPKFDVLRLMCRPYMFTASLPPSVVATATKSIEKIKSAAAKRENLWARTRQLHAGLKAAGFNLATQTPESAILAVLMPDQEVMVRMWAGMLTRGVYVNMARPPATPAGYFLVRCSVCAEHSEAQVETVLEAFRMAGAESGALPANRLAQAAE
jgi:8-amino-7-oxononanoate synthase